MAKQPFHSLIFFDAFGDRPLLFYMGSCIFLVVKRNQ